MWRMICFLPGRKILSQRYEHIKEAISSGVVDDNKAVGKRHTIAL